jgi:hypothetical protein
MPEWLQKTLRVLSVILFNGFMTAILVGFVRLLYLFGAKYLGSENSLLVFTIDYLSAVVRRLADILAPYSGEWPTQAIVVLATLLIGSALYAFRCRRPLAYGVLELCVAIASALFVADQIYYQLQQVSSYIVGAFSEMAALYIYVRGMDNIHRSLKRASRLQRMWEEVWYGKIVTF